MDLERLDYLIISLLLFSLVLTVILTSTHRQDNLGYRYGIQCGTSMFDGKNDCVMYKESIDDN